MLYIIFFLWFRQWRSCADLVLAPNMNIRFPLFLSIWRRARGQDLATCADLSHGYDYSYCIALEQSHRKAWPLLFLELSTILEIQWPKVRVFQPSIPSGPGCWPGVNTFGVHRRDVEPGPVKLAKSPQVVAGNFHPVKSIGQFVIFCIDENSLQQVRNLMNSISWLSI